MNPNKLATACEFGKYMISTDDGRWHRIHFFTPFLSNKTHQIYVRFVDVSDELYKMCKINDIENNEYVSYLDIYFNSFRSKEIEIQFMYYISNDWVKINSEDAISSLKPAIYYIHELSQKQSKILSLKNI